MSILWRIFTGILFVVPCWAGTLRVNTKTVPLKHSSAFASQRDLASSMVTSNIKVKNSRTSAKVVYGLYVRQLSQVAAGQPCSGSTIIYPNSGVGALANTSAGAIAMSVNIKAKKEAPIGANFLYSMIYNTTLYIQTVYPSSPPGCALPGCTWGSDSTIYNWCVQIGILSPVSITPGYTTANIVPVVYQVSTSDYDYNLVTSYQDIGPISCDDQELTCTVASSQTQSF